MAARFIDQLLVSIGFRPDTSGLDRVLRKTKDLDRQVRQIGRGLDIAIGAALGIGTATTMSDLAACPRINVLNDNRL